MKSSLIASATNDVVDLGLCHHLVVVLLSSISLLHGLRSVILIGACLLTVLATNMPVTWWGLHLFAISQSEEIWCTVLPTCCIVAMAIRYAFS